MDSNKETNSNESKDSLWSFQSFVETESYLENLGLQVNDPQPRFRLNELAPTGLCTPANTGTDFTMVNSSDDLSFVVLGKDSLDSIQASSLALYVDIKQKTSSIDYNSILSNLSSDEIQSKLIQLLQENSVLKETLNQNDIAMKKQFNTLATWQEELMKVHENHKKKFAETRDLINCLKKENEDLKLKLSNAQFDFEGNSFQMKDQSMNTITSPEVVELEKKVVSLSEELKSSKEQCHDLTEEIAHFMDLINTRNEELKKSQSTIQEQNIKIEKFESDDKLVSHNEDNKIVDNFCMLSLHPMEDRCDEKLIEEVILLKNRISVLDQELQSISLQAYDPNLHNRTSDEGYRQFLNHVKQYQEKLKILNDGYLSQISRYAAVQKYLKESTNILETIEHLFSFDKDDIARKQNEDLITYMKTLSNCRKRLIDEQLKIVDDRQTLIKVQSQIQKLFNDYHCVLNQLTIVVEENSKLQNLNNELTHEMSETLKEAEKSNEEQLRLDNERKYLEGERENLKIQFDNIISEKQLLEQERKNLFEEKTSLDQQSQLYETFQLDKNKVDKECEQLLIEKRSLEEFLKNKDIALEELRQQMVENIDSLNTALKCYENDFLAEREVKESLLRQSNLPNPPCGEETSNSCQFPTAFICPKCQKTFSVPQYLMEHIETCVV